LLADSRHNCMTNPSCCEYSIPTPDDGQYACPEHVEFFTKIKMRNSASCWLLLQGHSYKLYGDSRAPSEMKLCRFFSSVILSPATPLRLLSQKVYSALGHDYDSLKHTHARTHMPEYLKISHFVHGTYLFRLLSCGT